MSKEKKIRHIVLACSSLFLLLLLLLHSHNALAQNKKVSFLREWDVLAGGIVTTEIPEHPLTENFSITRFDLNLNKTVTNARIIIEKLPYFEAFENLSAEYKFKIHSFFNITHNIPSNSINKTTFYFRVEKEFLREIGKESEPKSIALLFFDGKNLEEQETEEYYDNDKFYYFKAESNSINNILIVLKEKPDKKIISKEKTLEPKKESEETNNKANETNEEIKNITENEKTQQKRNSRTWLMVPLIIMLLIIVYFVYETSRKRPKSVIVE